VRKLTRVASVNSSATCRVGTSHVISQSKHSSIDDSQYVVHVTNLTPGSDSPTHVARPLRGEVPERELRRREPELLGAHPPLARVL
jgi:hypothetical protein